MVSSVDSMVGRKVFGATCGTVSEVAGFDEIEGRADDVSATLSFASGRPDAVSTEGRVGVVSERLGGSAENAGATVGGIAGAGGKAAGGNAGGIAGGSFENRLGRLRLTVVGTNATDVPAFPTALAI